MVGQGLFGYFCGSPTLGCLTKVPRRKGETRRKIQCIEWICTLANKKLRVHIRYMCLAELRVTPLRRVTLQKRQSNQNASAPAYGPRCAQVPLAPVPLRGHAATGHPWPDRSSPGIHAGRPTPQNLHSASRRGGRSRSRSKAKSKARSKTKSKAGSEARSKTRSQTELSRVYPYGRSPVCSLALKSVLPSHPPPKAAINCTLAINRLCNRFNTVRSLDKAVVCTVTTSK